MNINDNIGWLKSLKQQIGQSQYRGLWHFEQVIDETIENIRPLAVSHGRLIDADKLLASFRKAIDEDNHFVNFFSLVDEAPTIIKAEVSE